MHIHLAYSKKYIFNILIIIVIIQSILIVNHVIKTIFIDDFEIRDGKGGKLAIHYDQIREEEFIRPVKRKYIYFDLGANNGDSVYNFFNEQLTYPKLLPPNLVNMVDWTVYAFEANPLFDDDLQRMKTKIEAGFGANKKSPAKERVVKLYKSTAVWVHDGHIEFYLDTINERNNFYGSSLKRAHPDVRDGKQKVNVSCVDLVRLLRELSVDDFVVVKMDVEGAEYDLLTHLIVNDALRYIDLMTVEYHKELSYFQTPEQVYNYIIKSSGVKLSKWV